MSSLRALPKTILPTASAVLLFASIACAQTATSNPALTANGSAKITPGLHGSILQLTTASGSESGSVFTTDQIGFDSRYRFKTFFQFQMTDPGGLGAADGMTFVLQREGPTAVGANGGDLGYLGIAPSVGVEFDTFYNPGIDINNNTVSIVMGGEMSDLDPSTPYGVTNCSNPTGVFGCMANGDVWSVWIDYDGTTLDLAIADNSTTRPANLISYPIDIAPLLGESSAYVGFTAATGAGWENHYILFWHFAAAPAGAGER